MLNPGRFGENDLPVRWREPLLIRSTGAFLVLCHPSSAVCGRSLASSMLPCSAPSAVSLQRHNSTSLGKVWLEMSTLSGFAWLHLSFSDITGDWLGIDQSTLNMSGSRCLAGQAGLGPIDSFGAESRCYFLVERHEPSTCAKAC
jgi:hypothetical protein